MATRVPILLADVRRQVGAPVHDDVALPALALSHVVECHSAAAELQCLLAHPEPKGLGGITSRIGLLFKRDKSVRLCSPPAPLRPPVIGGIRDTG